MSTRYKIFNVIVDEKTEVRRAVMRQDDVTYISYNSVLYIVKIDHFIVKTEGNPEEPIPVYKVVKKAVLS